MARTSDPAQQLAKVINDLQSERQAHVDAIAEIDATFDRFGIKVTGRKRRGRPVGSGVGVVKIQLRWKR